MIRNPEFKLVVDLFVIENKSTKLVSLCENLGYFLFDWKEFWAHYIYKHDGYICLEE